MFFPFRIGLHVAGSLSVFVWPVPYRSFPDEGPFFLRHILKDLRMLFRVDPELVQVDEL